MKFNHHKEVQLHCLQWVSTCVCSSGIGKVMLWRAWPQLAVYRPQEGRRAWSPSWTSMHLLPRDGNAAFALVNKFWFSAWWWFWLINICPLSAPEGLDVMAESDFCAWMNEYVNYFTSVALPMPCRTKIHNCKGFCIMGFWSPNSSIARSCICKRNSISPSMILQASWRCPLFWQLSVEFPLLENPVNHLSHILF